MSHCHCFCHDRYIHAFKLLELETLSVDTKVHCEFKDSNSGWLSRDGESVHDHMIIQYVYTSPEYDYSGDMYTHNLFQKLNKNVSSSLAVFSEQRIPPECSTKMQLSEEGTYIK